MFIDMAINENTETDTKLIETALKKLKYRKRLQQSRITYDLFKYECEMLTRN